ncbi:MAG TPA: hypothetical protein VLD65_01180, partial [Anaerolineales bacterium]|nr:hypothetical protein [Anaerolineales bacterium]
KTILFLVITLILLSGCGTSDKQASPGVSDTTNAYPAQPTQEEINNNSNAYPDAVMATEEIYEAYPAPDSGTSAADLYPQYFVDQLVVPSPGEGKAIITGQLLIDGDTSKPLITILYLSVVTPNSDPNKPPVVNLKIDSDPIATQEIKTGKFVFSDVIPGQYALVIWSTSNFSVIENNAGDKLIIEPHANEVTDLGIIPVNQ